MVSIISVLLLLILGYEVHCCPPNENVAPFCTCQYLFGDYQMTCKNVLSPDDLIGPLRAVAASSTKVFSLSIVNSSLMYLPHGIFRDTGIERVRFLSTEIMSLSDSDIAFEGLEDTLTELRATDAHFVSQWDWNQLRNLRRLSLIDVNWMTLGSVDEEFPRLPELTALGIIRAEISFIVDSAFSSLSKLTIFNVMNNDLTDLKRNMLPDPAPSLSIIDLSHNKISHLPEDFFKSMPSVAQVHLDNNQFITITEKPFSLALGNLQDLTMTGNPFRCDCRMRWLVGARTPFNFKGECSAPEALNGRSLSELDLKSLWC